MELTPEERQRIYLEEKARAEAQIQIAQKAKEAKSRRRANGCLIALGVVLLLGLIGTLLSPSSKTSYNVPAQSPGAPTAVAQGSDPTSTPIPQPFRGKWQANESKSTMDDSTTVVLSLAAEGVIAGWPSQVEHPVLILRCQEKRTEAYIKTGMAANTEYGKFNEATVRLRFDSAPARSYIAGESTDNEALFLPSPVTLIRTMTKHEKMRFQFTPFNSEPQEAEFDLTGLAEVVGPLQKACGWK